jgi:hypothetical protein
MDGAPVTFASRDATHRTLPRMPCAFICVMVTSQGSLGPTSMGATSPGIFAGIAGPTMATLSCREPSVRRRPVNGEPTMTMMAAPGVLCWTSGKVTLNSSPTNVPVLPAPGHFWVSTMSPVDDTAALPEWKSTFPPACGPDVGALVGAVVLGGALDGGTPVGGAEDGAIDGGATEGARECSAGVVGAVVRAPPRCPESATAAVAITTTPTAAPIAIRARPNRRPPVRAALGPGPPFGIPSPGAVGPADWVLPGAEGPADAG